MLILLFLFPILLCEYDKLIFEDNFDTENLNLSKWEYDLGNGINGWGNAELQYYRKNLDNIFIKDNQLHIKAKVENFGGFNYTSAKITTKHSFHFTYGYLETRIKLPYGKGIWPAFWMLGANIDINPWPNCGEIDIIEAINNDNTIYHYLHFKGTDNNGNDFGVQKEFTNRDEFHTYGMEWTKDEIIVSIDNKENFRKKLSELGTDAFNKPFYLLINLAVGGNFPGFDIEKEKFPLEMIIDYIRIYQEEENYEYLNKYLVWNDEFNDEILDTKKWSYSIGKDWGTNQIQYDTNRTDNIYLSTSNLHIKAKNEYYKGKQYTSGSINTRETFQFTYGIIEAKILFPSVNGVSPRFFLSTDYKQYFNENNKIDALIGRDGDNIISSGCIWGPNSYYYFKEMKYDITKFNIYTILWDKNYITIYADDLEIYKIDITPEDLIAFHNPFYLNLNVLVGGNTVNKAVNSYAFPVEMLVDYIRVYQYDINNTIIMNDTDDIYNLNYSNSTDMISENITNSNNIENNISSIIDENMIKTTYNSLNDISDTTNTYTNNNNINSDITNENSTISNIDNITYDINLEGMTNTNQISNIWYTNYNSDDNSYDISNENPSENIINETFTSSIISGVNSEYSKEENIETSPNEEEYSTNFKEELNTTYIYIENNTQNLTQNIISIYNTQESNENEEPYYTDNLTDKNEINYMKGTVEISSDIKSNNSEYIEFNNNYNISNNSQDIGVGGNSDLNKPNDTNEKTNNAFFNYYIIVFNLFLILFLLF